MTVNDYCTISELWASLPDLTQDDNLATYLSRAITAASRSVDKSTKRFAGAYYVSADTTKYYDGTVMPTSIYNPFHDYTYKNGNSRINGNFLRLDELASITSISFSFNGSVTSYTALSSADYYLWPYDASDLGIPYTGLYLDVLNGAYGAFPANQKSIKVVGKFGYSTAIPDEIKQLTIMQAGRYFARAKQHYQNSMSIVENENTITFTDKLDTDIEKMIKFETRLSI